MQERSGCPINLSTEILGDRWTLVILRDMMFGSRRTFRDILTNSLEGIATNILSDRMKKLVAEGMVTRAPDPDHRQKTIYSLTEKAIALVPVMAALGGWGRRYLPVTPELAIRAQVLEEGGPPMWEAFSDELRHIHLGAAPPRESALAAMQAAYERVAAEEAGRA